MMKQDESQSVETEVRSADFNNSTSRETTVVTLHVTPSAYGRYRKLDIFA